ncbi:MAG: MlaD family protein [Planctomycetota bacterium]|jgi:ABC-type transporter Mla subunit MlaD
MISPEKQKKLNLLTGWIVVAVVALIIASSAGLLSFKQTQPEGHKYVAIVANGGGVDKGTWVYMKGVKVGNVTATELVQHEGQPHMRIEVSIDLHDDAGNELTIPADSRFVVNGPGLGSTPTIVVVWGESEDSLQDGEEFALATPAAEVSGMSGWVEKGEAIHREVSDSVDNAKKEALAQEITESLASIRRNLSEFESNMAIASEKMSEFGQSATDAEDSMTELRRNVEQQTEQIQKNLVAIDESTSSSDGGLDDLTASLASFQSAVEKWSDVAAQTKTATEGAVLREMLRDLRWQSAQLVAWGETLKRDPSNTDGGGRHSEKARKFNAGSGPLGRFGGKTRMKDTE